MCQRRISRRRAWTLGIVGFFIAAGGLACFVYGLETMPNSVPQDPMAPIVYPPNPAQTAEQLNQYKIQSTAFKYTMAGLAGMIFPIIVAVIVNCCYEVDLSEIRVAPIPRSMTTPRPRLDV